MMNRRDLAKGLGLMTMAIAAGPAMAAGEASAAGISFPNGPWAETGLIRRTGGVLHYARIGATEQFRPPVILLHKLGGWLADWRDVAPLIANGREVIAFDLPGHGNSRMDSPPPYIQTLGETAAMLVGAFDEMGLTQVDVIGTSLGGCVGTSLAAFYPERVRRLAVVSSVLGRARTLAEIAEIVDRGQPHIYGPDGLPLATGTESMASAFGIVNLERINAEGNASRMQAGRWIQCQERGVVITDIAANLKRIEAETLLLYGEYDPTFVQFRAAAETALRHSRTAYVPNSGAFVTQDNPPATAVILNEFLENG